MEKEEDLPSLSYSVPSSIPTFFGSLHNSLFLVTHTLHSHNMARKSF